MLEYLSNNPAHAALTALNLVVLVVNVILLFLNRRLLNEAEDALAEMEERFHADNVHGSMEAANGKR